MSSPFLFLTENVQPAEDDQEVVSLEEGAMMLAECYETSAVLNEALLKAEFAIHRQTQMLSEDAAEEKKQGFFGKAKDKVVATAKIVWEKLVKVYNSVMDKAKSLIGGFKAKKNAVLLMSKEAAEALPKLVGYVNDAAKAVGSEKGEVEKAKTDFDALIKEARGGKGKEGKVKLKDANKIAGGMTAVANGAKVANARLKGEIDALQGAKDAESAGTRMAALRRAQSHAMSIATMASAVAVLVVSKTSVAVDTPAA